MKTNNAAVTMRETNNAKTNNADKVIMRCKEERGTKMKEDKTIMRSKHNQTKPQTETQTEKQD